MTEEDKADLLELTRSMVRIDTANPGSGEEKLAGFIESWIKEETGLRAEFTYFAPGRCNVTAVLPGRKTQTVLLAGHMDTVPVGAGWHCDPLLAEEVDGRLYGRGTVDMKSGLAAAMIAFRAAARKGKLPEKTLLLAATADEEAGMRGARLLVDSGIVKEDTWVLDLDSVDEKLVQGHKGKCWYKVSVAGKAAHSMHPEQGVDANAAMAEIISSFRKELSTCSEDLIFGKSTVSFSTVHGGTGWTAVPERSELCMDVRLAPPITEADTNAMLQRAIENAAAIIPGIKAEYTLVESFPWVRIDTEAPLLQAMQRAVFSVTGENKAPAMIGGYTDSGAIAALTGQRNCLSYGPQGGNLHAADEWLSIASIERVYSVVTAFLNKELFGE